MDPYKKSFEILEKPFFKYQKIIINFQEERRLMKEMLKVMDEHNQIKVELKKDENEQKSPFEHRQTLLEKDYSFDNFKPVFLKT